MTRKQYAERIRTRTAKVYLFPIKYPDLEKAFARAEASCKLKWDMKSSIPNKRRDAFCVRLPWNNATSTAAKGAPLSFRLEQVNQYACDVVFPAKILSYAARLLGYSSMELHDLLRSLDYYYK
jgi:hypothetical protein